MEFPYRWFAFYNVSYFILWFPLGVVLLYSGMYAPEEVTLWGSGIVAMRTALFIFIPVSVLLGLSGLILKTSAPVFCRMLLVAPTFFVAIVLVLLFVMLNTALGFDQESISFLVYPIFAWVPLCIKVWEYYQGMRN